MIQFIGNSYSSDLLLKNKKEITETTRGKDLEKVEKEESFLISDVAKHGCSGGTISELIYYDDTVKFHDKHEEEIREALSEGRVRRG